MDAYLPKNKTNKQKNALSKEQEKDMSGQKLTQIGNMMTGNKLFGLTYENLTIWFITQSLCPQTNW